MSLKIAYILLSFLMTAILILCGIQTIDKSSKDSSVKSRKKGILIGGLILWHLYVFLMAYSGILDNYDFPPRFALLLIIPLFLFTGVFLYRNRSSHWISLIPEHWLISIQSFRILVESIFVASVAQGILNKEVTIEGYNFDMIFALTAPVLGYLAYKRMVPPKITILWNYLGLLVLLSVIIVFISSVYLPHLFGSETILLPKVAVKYPYVLVAGFLMPVAVFIHVLSIVQLSKKRGG